MILELFLILSVIFIVMGGLGLIFAYFDEDMRALWKYLTLLLVLGIIFGGYVILNDKEITVTQEIVSLSDSFGASGSFVLGSGTIKSQLYYVVVIKNTDGSYQQEIIGREFKNIRLYETNETPHYEYSYMESGWKKGSDLKIYIPKDTIIKQYSIDGV